MAPFAKGREGAAECFVQCPFRIAGGTVGVEGTVSNLGGQAGGNGFGKVLYIFVRGITPLLLLTRQGFAELMKPCVKVIAEIERFHFPFVPLVYFKAVADKVHEGAASVAFKAGDGAEEAASRFKEPLRQLSRKRRCFVFIPETGKGVGDVIFIAPVLCPAHQAGPGRVFFRHFFPEYGGKQGEGLPGIGEIGAVPFPVLRREGALFGSIAQAAELGNEEGRLRVIMVIVYGGHGDVEGFLRSGEGEVREKLLLVHLFQKAFAENEAAVFENLLPFQFREEASLFHAAGKFSFHRAGNEDGIRFHGITSVHAGDGHMVQGGRNGGVGEGGKAVFKDGEEILF